MAIDGRSQKRAVLNAGVETIITFSNTMHNLSIMADGGVVYFKVNDTISGVNDLTANYLKDGATVDIYKSQSIKELHLYTATSGVTIQWDAP